MDGSTRIFCKIFYPEKFEILRKNCGVEKIYIQSLSHCKKWSNDGGKSGSAFLKTRGKIRIYKIKKIRKLKIKIKKLTNKNKNKNKRN